MNPSESIIGVILAGGLARRMGGGDKCLLPLAGKTLLQRTIERAQPQVTNLLLNANGSSLRFARSRLPVVADIYANNPGPLAGIHACLTRMSRDNPDTEWLVSFASDTPFFPSDLAEHLHAAALTEHALIAVATSKGQTHPTFALWHASLLEKISDALAIGESLSLQDFIQQQKHTLVDFSVDTYDPFFNINTPQDLYTAEPLAALIK
jgi:molybdenum cofactor guanylyltransferase